jgi:hypothetical protein
VTGKAELVDHDTYKTPFNMIISATPPAYVNSCSRYRGKLDAVAASGHAGL